MLSQVLIRRRAWWFNKVPLSVMTVLLLVDGGPMTLGALGALSLVVIAVCAAGNYGYALNDLYDVAEDARVARPNAAAALGRVRMWLIIAASALVALVAAWTGAGLKGLGLTAAELLLPLAYSVPPLRIKERKWLGVLADALAAHVYPALLAVLTVEFLGVWTVPPMVTDALLLWAVAAGLRGILSHQLHTADRDARAGLTTVVHDLGRGRLERFIIFGLLPVEALSLTGAILLCRTGPVAWSLGALYLACEAYRSFDPRFTVKALRPAGQRYLPFVQETFYKAWGPLVLALDGMRGAPWFGLLAPLYVAFFWPHVRAEMTRLRQLASAVSHRPRKA